MREFDEQFETKKVSECDKVRVNDSHDHCSKALEIIRESNLKKCDAGPFFGTKVKVKKSVACYLYALGFDKRFRGKGKMFPGDISDVHCVPKSIEQVIDLIEKDVNHLGRSFRRVTFEEELAQDEYRIAIAAKFGDLTLIRDYHFYRQDLNGKGIWSCKFKGFEPTQEDASGKLIYNPEFADRDYYRNRDRLPFVSHKYDKFLGFFAVGLPRPIYEM